MLLEITSEEGLIRKLELVGYFLYAQIGGLEQDFYFQYDMFVDDAFGCYT